MRIIDPVRGFLRAINDFPYDTARASQQREITTLRDIPASALLQRLRLANSILKKLPINNKNKYQCILCYIRMRVKISEYYYLRKKIANLQIIATLFSVINYSC